MALVSMYKPCSCAKTRRLSTRISPALLRAIQAGAALVAATLCVAAAASTLPTIASGSRTLVAVEPLLQDLQIAYTVQGTRLNVAGRIYPNALVYSAGLDYADPVALAQFLHVSLSKKNGVYVFSPPDQSADLQRWAPLSAADLQTVRTELLQALNQHRAAEGRPELVGDPIAEQAAQYQANDMSQAGAMRHEDSTGRSPLQRYVAFGGRAQAYGENVGWYSLCVTGSPALWSVVSKLDAEMMAEQPPDDGHRVNILSQQYTAVGIGITVGQHGLYLAEDFVGR